MRVAGRTRPWLAAAAALALVAGAAGALPGGAGILDRSHPRARPGTAGLDRAAAGAAFAPSSAEVAVLLQRRSDAVRRGDRGEWLATLDPASGAFRTRQAALFDRLRLLPITRWSYQPPDPGRGQPVNPSSAPLPAPAPSTGSGAGMAAARAVDVQLAYRLAGDTRDTVRDQHLLLRRAATGWLVAGAQPSSPQDLWDLGPIAVARGARSLVIGSAAQRVALPRFASDVDAAAARVDRVWGSGWPRTVVVEIPGTPTAMASVLGSTADTGLDQVAAVTIGDVDISAGAGGTGADRIVVNATAFAGFGPMGRRVVLTHEVTHVATRAASRIAPPLWLQEGFADYLAYRGTGLPRRVIAGDVLALVRAGRTPTHLPTEADFDPARARIAPAYASAWLALDLIARHGGTPRVVAFYRAAAGITDPAPGLLGSTAPAPETSALRLAAARRAPVLHTAVTVADPTLTLTRPDTETEVRAAFTAVLAVDEATFVRHWRAYLVAVARGTR